MTLTRPTPASASTRMNSVQSKCRMYLRSPLAISAALPKLRVSLRVSRRIVVEHARDFGLRRRRVELKVALEHVVNHRCGRAAAVTAMLDDTGGRDCRMILRRERDEPCVIFELFRSLVFGLVFTDRGFAADDLRGAGF